jgi:HPt (histidine-containing phosphotransfer) domain-containing protein
MGDGIFIPDDERAESAEACCNAAGRCRLPVVAIVACRSTASLCWKTPETFAEHHPNEDKEPPQKEYGRTTTSVVALETGPARVARIEMPPGLKEIVPGYLDARREELPEMMKLLAASGFERLASLGHNIKGTGGSYGFPELTRMGAALEHSAKQADAAALSTQLIQRVGVPESSFSELNTRPTDAAVYASRTASRRPAQNSRSGWIRYLLSCRALSSPAPCRFTPAH